MTNQVFLTGFLGKDPERRTLQNGGEVVRLSVATDDGWKDKTTGEWQTKTNWHSVICWRNAATKAKTFLKGQKVFVRGRNTSRTWQNEAGENRHVYEVEGLEVERIDHEKKGSSSHPLPTEQDLQSKAIAKEADNSGADDLPF